MENQKSKKQPKQPKQQMSWHKKAQFRDDKNNWQDLPIVDYRVSPESIAFESAKKGLHTRVVELKLNGKIDVLRIFRIQRRRSR